MTKSRRYIGVFLSMLALLLIGMVGCGSKRALPDNPSQFQRYTVDLTMHSDILSEDIHYCVYLPESYREDTDKRYPVVYMLHGYGDNYLSWNGKYLNANARISSLEKNGLGEMIYIFPDGFTSYYCNTYTGKYNYMDMFVYELVPYIDETLRTIGSRDGRALIGYSMGGFGAMILALKHPEVFSFSAPLSMSFRTDAQYMTESASGWNKQWGRIFGGEGQVGAARLTDWYLEHSPYRQFCDENKKELSNVRWFFTCGDDEEQLLVANDSLHVLLRERGFEHEYRVANGAHTSSYWMNALNEVLPWLDSYLNKATAWPESCRQTYEKKNIQIEEDGCVKSSLFDSSGAGMGVFFFHDGLPDTEVSDAMGVAYSENTKNSFIYLPCDLSARSVAEWVAYWDSKYTLTSKSAVSFDAAGSPVSEARAYFNFEVFVDAQISDFEANPADKFYFACTDESGYYQDMDDLYRSCKRNGATFEYRVINASGNKSEDRLRELFLLRSYMTY